MSDAQGTFEEVLATASPEMQELCRELKKQIAKLHKAYVEVAWPRQKIAGYGVGPKKMTEHYAYIAVNKAHVNLGFYYGAHLPDPSGMLEGTGKNLRHIRVRDLATAKSKPLVALLRASIAERKKALS